MRAGPLRGAVAALTAVDVTLRPASARAALDLLRPVPVDPLPLTRDGDPIEVLHQLPPLSPNALAEAESSRTQPLVAAAPAPAPTLVGPARPKRARRRPSGLVTAVIGAAALIAVGVPVTLTLTSGGGGSGSPTRPPTSTHTQPSVGQASSNAGGTQSGGVVNQTVEIGDKCTFLVEGNQAKTSKGGTAVCRRRTDGTYVWERA